MRITEETVLSLLRNVYDPELYVNIVDLGLVYEVTLGERNGKTDIAVKMTLTSPACPAGPQLIEEVKQTLRELGEEVGQVDVKIVLNPPWTPDRMTEEARDELGMY